MDATKYIWMNDKLVNWDEAKVHVLTHILHYGSAVFEGIRCYNTSKGKAIFRLNDHIKRLVKSANFLKMNIPYSNEILLNAVVKTVQANEVSECYIRPIIYYGYGVMGLNPSKAHVDEGPGENIFIVKDNVIYTPELGSILPGITRKTIVRLAKDLGYDVVKTELELIDVIDADEVFFTGTAAEIHPIIQVDDTVINNGKIGEVTIKLKKMYSDVVHGKLDSYNYWLTYI